MIKWTPGRILRTANEIEEFIMNKIKKGNLTSKTETSDLYYAVQYGMDSLDYAATALREHRDSLLEKEKG